MTNNKLKTITLILVALSFAVTALIMTFMPEQVPIHYNIAGEADSIGSKYVYYIFPAFGLLMVLILSLCERSRQIQSNEKRVLQITGIFSLLLFDVLGFLFMVKSISYVPGATQVPDSDVYKITFIAIGVLFVLLGNMMPKFRRNQFCGLRTKWSLSSDSVWQKSNRFAGIISVICGFAMIVLGALLSGTAVIVSNLVLVIVWIVICIAASYIYYKAEQI